MTTQPSDWAVDPVTKLAPCPFCGSKAHIDRESDMDGFGTFYFVKCDKCRARSGQKYVSTGNDCPLFYAEVRDAWNKRARELDASGTTNSAQISSSLVVGDAVDAVDAGGGE